MTDKTQRLIDERDRLTERLKQLNVKSIGRDRVVERIEAIGQELESIKNKAV